MSRTTGLLALFRLRLTLSVCAAPTNPETAYPHLAIWYDLRRSE